MQLKGAFPQECHTQTKECGSIASLSLIFKYIKQAVFLCKHCQIMWFVQNT